MVDDFSRAAFLLFSLAAEYSPATLPAVCAAFLPTALTVFLTADPADLATSFAWALTLGLGLEASRFFAIAPASLPGFSF